MLTSHWTRLIALLLVTGLAACSGGSSGFDIVPESTAISRALASGRCVAQPSLRICPADVPAPGRGPEQIDTAPVESTACVQDAAGFACPLAVPFLPSGFAPTVAYRLAVREPVPGQGWVIGLAVRPEGPGAPSTDAPVTVDVPAASAPGGFETQFAILVFLDGDGTTPDRVDTLAETGADYVFVTRKTTVVALPQ